MEIDELSNLNIVNSLLKTKSVLGRHRKICVAVSGGSDSDILIELVEQCKHDFNEISYVFYDTGLEYEATKIHLEKLEFKYNIIINRVKALKPIPTACKQYGQPFLSKYVSEMIMRLQKHNFKWENKSFEELYKEYPKCKIALKWWTNDNGKKSSFNINRNKYLKEFLTINPPQFKISNLCCKWSKKKPAEKFLKENNFDLCILGIRKAEGGIRSTNYKNCFTNNDNKENKDYNDYRPIFYYNDKDKEEFNDLFNVVNSKCYNEYGLKRTGCVGCPYGNPIAELKIVNIYEPNLGKAVENVFKESYNYLNKFKQFKTEQEG